ncbi:poly-gamma-glutamate synthesis protein [Pandoravirus japonicus]|uniref:Poly-gamma-glutamate synthesis protein n=1 Tax=Pandoravirus japonicus TaxID=2823154 RepID=A0A811BME9_9VIRU|nr:poly-gamma-glutamate synthesis protein [Pandoravirus japonicus]
MATVPTGERAITLFLCGDVMIGRGIDQVLPWPGDLALYEPGADSAGDYVRLAEAAAGPIPRPVGPGYIWGDALVELHDRAPDVRIINLETALTWRGAPWSGKAIHYRATPANAAALAVAGVDCCAVANNHVLDWGYVGLVDTLGTLASLGIAAVGAGTDILQAQAPATVSAPAGNVHVFAYATESAGVPASWAATPTRPGVNLLRDLSPATADEIAAAVRRAKRPGDLVAVSVHWGGNWGYDVPDAHVAFAHALIDRAGVDVVHGHSSHHAKAIEVYRGRLVLYGAGDFIDDYEGIRGHQEFRPDLALMYFCAVDPDDDRLIGLCMVPMQRERFRLQRATDADALWLRAMLTREGARFGSAAHLDAAGDLVPSWTGMPQAPTLAGEHGAQP